MIINLKTKYNIGDNVFYFEKQTITGTEFTGFIFKVTIMAIIVTTEKTFVYETNKGIIYGNELFTTLKDAKQWAKDNGYTVGGKHWGRVKYCG